jgi:putative ABC transport system permease protein
MGMIGRGVKNAFRNVIRTVSIVFILAISIALVLIMFLSLKAVQAKIDSVKGSMGNTVTVSPAGVRGFEGGGELLTTSSLNTISALSHVAKASGTLTDRLTPGQNTSLTASLEPGSFGRRQQSSQTEGRMPNNLSMPITVTSTNDLTNTQALNINELKVTSGASFDGKTSNNIALIGADLANKNNLKVGSVFKAYNTDITVAGIFDSGNRFTNSSLLMPIKAVQKLSGQTDQVSNINVQVDSVDNISSVQTEIKGKLGDKADVVSSIDTVKEAVKPLENIKTISIYSLLGSLVAGSVIIFLTMLMIVRERRREIGVLKAIGASNVNVTAQFVVESLTLTIMSSVLGIIGGFAFSNPVLKALVSNSISTASNGQGPRPGGGGFMSRLSGAMPGVQNTLRDIQAVIGYEVILYGILAALIIAVIGSAIPAYFIAKIRPAEIMRTD